MSDNRFGVSWRDRAVGCFLLLALPVALGVCLWPKSPPPPPPAFRDGDIVYLKSGSPPMVVAFQAPITGQYAVAGFSADGTPFRIYCYPYELTTTPPTQPSPSVNVTLTTKKE